MRREFFFRGRKDDRDDRRATKPRGLDDPDLHHVPGSPRPVGGEGGVEPAAQMPDHLLQTRCATTAGGPAHHQMAEPLKRARYVFPIAVPAAEDRQPAAARRPQVGIGHHQQLIVEEGVHVRPALPAQGQYRLFVHPLPAHQPAQRADQAGGQWRGQSQEPPVEKEHDRRRLRSSGIIAAEGDSAVGREGRPDFLDSSGPGAGASMILLRHRGGSDHSPDLRPALDSHGDVCAKPMPQPGATLTEILICE